MHEELYIYHVLLAQLQTDTVSLMLPLSSNDWSKINNRINDMISNNIITEVNLRSQTFCGNDHSFIRAFTFSLKECRRRYKVYIDIAEPKSGSRSTDRIIRFSFEASKLTFDNRRRLRRFLISILSKKVFRYIPKVGYFSRVDFCVDLPFWTADQLCLDMDKSNKSWIKVYANGGKSVTVTSNSKISRATIYDKILQLEAKHRISNIITIPVIRYEVTFSGQYKYSDLYELFNPFEIIKIYSTNFSPRHFNKEFIRNVLEDGIPAAMNHAGGHSEKYRKRLGMYQVQLFNSNELWSQLPAALDFLQIFYPKSKSLLLK